MDAEVQTGVRIPSAWRAMAALSEALEMLAQNPDLIGEDVAIALQSEAPDAVKFLEGMIAACEHARLTVERDVAYAELVTGRARRSAEIWEQRKVLTLKVMEQMRLKTYNAPTGTATAAIVPAVAVIIDENLLPDKFRVPVPATWRPAKRALTAALNGKRKVPGAVLGNGGVSLRIR